MNVVFRLGIIFSAVVLLLPSCSSVSIEEPLAATTEAELREALEGSWSSGDGDVFRVAFDEDGSGELAYIDRQDDEFRLGKGELAAVEVDERTFLSIRIEEDDEEPESYVFAEYVITDSGDLVIWPPDVDSFKNAVEQGALEGSATTGDYGTVTVTLSSDAAAVLQFFTEHPEASDTREPMVSRKIRG